MINERPTTVLVAEDDEDGRHAVACVLRDDGCIVLEAPDGRSALEILARAADEGGQVPDVVLLDFVMPGFSGLGILRALRRFRRAPKAIVMTAFPDPSVDVFARALGAVRVLRKPLDADELCAAVREAAAAQGGDARAG